MISLPVAIALSVTIARRGASIGVGALWGVVIALTLSLGFIFVGKSLLPQGHENGTRRC
jgi:hypothetical protein